MQFLKIYIFCVCCCIYYYCYYINSAPLSCIYIYSSESTSFYVTKCFMFKLVSKYYRCYRISPWNWRFVSFCMRRYRENFKVQSFLYYDIKKHKNRKRQLKMIKIDFFFLPFYTPLIQSERYKTIVSFKFLILFPVYLTLRYQTIRVSLLYHHVNMTVDYFFLLYFIFFLSSVCWNEEN